MTILCVVVASDVPERYRCRRGAGRHADGAICRDILAETGANLCGFEEADGARAQVCQQTDALTLWAHRLPPSVTRGANAGLPTGAPEN